MKKALLILSKLPNIHTLHDTITEGYNLWNTFYGFMCKVGFGARGSLDEPAAPAGPVEVDPALAQATDTEYMQASGLL